MTKHRSIEGESIQVSDEVVRNQIEKIRDDLLREQDVPGRPEPSTRAKVKAEAKGLWSGLKNAASEAVEPIWDRKEEIVIAIATKLIKGWIERQLQKHSK